MLRYENYDREKDFTKEYHETNHKHRIFPLSKEGINKYLKQAVFLRENPNPTNENKEVKIDTKNIRYRNINPIDISNGNKLYLKTDDLSEKKQENITSNKTIILRNYSYNKPKINFGESFRRNIKFKPKFKYFEPIIISKTLKNKYLVKGGYHTKSKSCSKIKPKELPLITYNKILGDRKIEIKEFDAFLFSSSLCKTFTNHKSYYMGERYNPQNYQLDKTRNRTVRNEFGALFSN